MSSTQADRSFRDLAKLHLGLAVLVGLPLWALVDEQRGLTRVWAEVRAGSPAVTYHHGYVATVAVVFFGSLWIMALFSRAIRRRRLGNFLLWFVAVPLAVGALAFAIYQRQAIVERLTTAGYHYCGTTHHSRQTPRHTYATPATGCPAP